MVELCLIFLPLFAIFLGVIDFSVVIFLRGMYQAAVREGVRYAITYNTTYDGAACGTHTQCIQRVVQANTLGFLNGATGASYIKVNFYSPENLATPLAPALMILLGGAFTIGISLVKAIQVGQVCRNANVLCVRGVDLPRLENQKLIVKTAMGLGLNVPNTYNPDPNGKAVVILTRVIRVGPNACNAGIPTWDQSNQQKGLHLATTDTRQLSNLFATIASSLLRLSQ